MKKIAIALVGVLALLSIGCSSPVAPDSGLGPTGGSKKLVGTWTNVTVSYSDLSVTPAASNREGTWTKTVITDYPTVPVATVTGTVTNYNWLASDVYTRTVTTNVEINASGSFVKTVTTAEVRTARAAAPANTATVTYSGATAAIVAGTKTNTVTETYTVTVVGRVYKQEYSKTNATNYTGYNFDTAATSVANDNTSTTTGSNVTEVATAAALAYNTTDLSSPMVQTVKGTTVGVPTNKASTSTSTKTITFLADGTYTAIEVVDVNQPAIDAVAATANSAAVIATAAGTTKETTTVTGVYTNTKVSYDGFTYFAQTGVYKELQDLFQYEKTKTVSAIGTGYLISANYPATAKTTKTTTISTTNTDIVINDTALIMGFGTNSGNANNGVVFIKS